MPSEKIIDKIVKLKKMSDGAKAIGSEIEAEAFASMLQKMLLDHRLEMSDIEFASMEKESAVERHFIDYEQYPDIKIKKQRVMWIERLAGVVARAHFCEILVHPGSSFITLIGRHEDWAVAEFALCTLQRAAAKMAKTADYQHRLRCHREHKPVGRGFKESWLESFVVRIADRYEAERSSRLGQSTALVRVNRAEKAVADFMKQFTKKSSALSSHTKFHPEGARQGRAAADAINLRVNAVTTKNQKELVK
jgi:hypothetical protein